LSLARARTLELNAKAASARGVDVDSVLGGALPEQVASSVLTELRGQYANLRQEADRQAIRLGPRHPERQALDAQLAGLREQISTELRRTISSIQVELKRAVQLEQELAARLAQLKIQQGGVNEEMVTLRELEREAAARRDVYEGFLKRARETGEQKDVNSANMIVISPAYPPLDPTGPSRATISLTGMMLGFFAGVGLGGMRGAYQGLRQNIGLPQQRRRWQRWRSAEDRAATAPHRPDPQPAAVADADLAADRRAEEIVRRVSESTPVEAEAAPATASPVEPPEAAKAVQPMDTPMTDPYAPPYAPVPLGYPQPAGYPAGLQPVYAQPGSMPLPPAYAHPQMTPQGVYPVPYAPPFQGQVYPYPAGAYPYPQAQQFQAWPPQAAPVPYYPQQPAPAANPQTVSPAASTEATRQEKQRADNQSQIEEIRESLREFREAVRDFTESRGRRKFF
jgi:succinoglycan biosynthesis transport protein ExoP